MAALAVGSKAPDFALENQDGRRVSLMDFAGKLLVIYFYPKDNTPGCQKEAESFREHYAKLKSKGAEVVGVSKDTVASHLKFREKLSLPFDLLSDPGLDVLKAYGAWGKKVMYGREAEGTIRSTVIVDRDGKVAAVFPRVKPEGHAEEVLRKIEALV